MSESPSRRPADYADVLAAPDNLVAELVDGELHTSPRPAARHARCTTRLVNRLGPPFDEDRVGPGGWVLLIEPELHLGPHVVVPDLAGWRRERMPEMPDDPWFTLAPDWVCEVLSPSTQSFDRVRKMRVYAEAGVRHAWLVDPAAEILEVFRLHQGSWLRVGSHAGTERVRAEPFDAVELDLAGLWAR